MQIKIQTSIAGHADPRYDLPDFSFAPGQLVDVHPDLAAAWLASGVAAPAPAASPVAKTRKLKREEIPGIFQAQEAELQ